VISYSTSGRVLHTLAFVFFIIGLIVVNAGIRNLIDKIKYIRNSVVITGKVVDIKKEYFSPSLDGGSMPTFIPIIEYVDLRDGNVKKFESNTGFPDGVYSINDKIEVRYYYDEDETELFINNWLAKWGAPTFLISIGIIFMSVAIIGIS
jgi:hypothetical protein